MWAFPFLEAMISRLLLLANSLGVFLYIAWQGIERFLWESFGTWVISPVIYTRLCPEAFKPGMIRALNSYPFLGDIMCVVPVVMLLLSVVLGVLAYRKRSVFLATLSCVLLSTIFVVYHSVKHMGIQVQYI